MGRWVEYGLRERLASWDSLRFLPEEVAGPWSNPWVVP